MKKIIFCCIAATFALNGIAFASTSTPCNKFEIHLTNKLSDDLLVTTADMKGADIDPSNIKKIKSNKTRVFTVFGSQDDVLMNGEFVLHTITVPSKTVKVEFELKNVLAVCEHTDKSPASDVPVDKTRSPGKVRYTIG